MADHFLLKSGHEVEACLPHGAGLALESHAELAETLRRKIGPEAVQLFAEPFVSRDKSGKALQIAWYGPQGGTVRPLSDLDPAARRAAEDRLHLLLPRIEALAADPLVAAALSLSSDADILTVDGLPVLVNWGVRSALGQNPLGGFLTGGRSAAAPPAPTPTAAPAAVPPPLPEMPPPVAPIAAPPGLPAIAWVPLVVLLLLAGLALAWVLWPGTRIFPSVAEIAPATVDATERAELDALRARRDALQAALTGAQCRPDGQLVLPGNISPEGLALPAPGAPLPATPSPVAPDAPVAPAPERVTVPAQAEGEAATLLTAVEASTVMVVGLGPETISTGSGFVIAPGLIVTNHHVIDGAKPDGLYVTNHALGRAVPAKILKAEGPFETTGRDFALLQIDETDLPALSLAAPEASLKLHHVVAAGFPGDVMESDAGYNRLMEGDASAIPELVVVDGTVNTRQDMENGAGVLVHSAPLSSGNSGGPLVDFCGRVLGVNTFVRKGPMRTLNFAVETKALQAFLQGTPAAVEVQTGPCAPEVTAPAANPAANPAASPTEEAPAAPPAAPPAASADP